MIDYKYDGNDKIPYHYTYSEYDKENRLVGYSEINANNIPSSGTIASNKLSYTYDLEGKVTKITYPPSLNDSISSIEFEYNWITQVKAKINGVYKELRDYNYNDDGTINNIKDFIYDVNANSNGHILKKYTYDDFGRVSTMKYYNSNDLNTVKESYRYTYDHNSNIKSEYIINNYPTNNSDKIDETREYTYDQMNRLSQSSVEDINRNKLYRVFYSYDSVGNRTSITNEDEGTRTSYSYNGLNQLVSSTESKLSNAEEIVSNKTYSYDKNGNNISEVDSVKNIAKEMTYDVDNRLDTYNQIKGNEIITQNNLYNGNGQRIQKQEGNNTINYFYQGSNVLYTTNADGNKTSHNFIGLEGNTISTMRYNLSGFEYYVYNKDIKGSISNIVDNNYNAKVSYTYSDFGETEIKGDTTFYNEIAYTGGIYDNISSLYYLNARYYNPEDGRFITQDTYRGESNNPSSLHLYAYCVNNPINYVDPTGNKKETIQKIINIYINGPKKYSFKVDKLLKYKAKFRMIAKFGDDQKKWYKNKIWDTGNTHTIYRSLLNAKSAYNIIDRYSSPGVTAVEVLTVASYYFMYTLQPDKAVLAEALIPYVQAAQIGLSVRAIIKYNYYVRKAENSFKKI